jgi:hypothetical protein
MTRLNAPKFWVAAAALTALVTVSAAQFVGDPGDEVVTRAQLFSRVQLIDVDDGVTLRLDRQTGALFRFRGETGRNARGTFVSVARPLRENTSGFLEIHRAGRATFLIDAVTGNTWILRQRSATNAAWIPVNLLGGNSQ